MKKTARTAKKTSAKTAKAAKKNKTARKTAVKTAKPAAKKGHHVIKHQPVAFARQELAEIRQKLNELRDSLSKNVEDKKNLDMLDPEVGDSIDQATQSLDKEILFELSDNERKMLDSIDASLRKMDNGNYGLCEHCKHPIEKKRLKALPSARYCMPCQSGTEKSRV
jgi:DnaK suppressor protein